MQGYSNVHRIHFPVLHGCLQQEQPLWSGEIDSLKSACSCLDGGRHHMYSWMCRKMDPHTKSHLALHEPLPGLSGTLRITTTGFSFLPSVPFLFLFCITYVFDENLLTSQMVQSSLNWWPLDAGQLPVHSPSAERLQLMWKLMIKVILCIKLSKVM